MANAYSIAAILPKGNPSSSPESKMINPRSTDSPAESGILDAFARLKIFQRGEQRAIHKPLLILFALGRIAQGGERLMDFASIEGDFKRLLEEFGPSSAPSSRHYPFWHLATDAEGGLWELKGPQAILNRPRSVTPNLTELRANHVQGGFSKRVFEAFRRDGRLRSDLARLILEAHFPDSLREDVLAATGIVMDSGVSPDVPAAQPARRRDPSFRERVLRAYEYRCCVCGFDLRIGAMSVGLEAAHIQWFQAEGPDLETNGLALCSLHHKIFDLGAFTVRPDSFTLVFSQHTAMSDATKVRLLSHHGVGIILPQSERFYPSRQRLHWHATQVFKSPGRDT
jgi:putative restriction endonuclease